MPARRWRIVGRSGAGKTTLVNLLPRFYDVTGGRILIDGHDMRDVTLASLRGADRHRDAGDGAVRRHHRRQHRLRPAGGDAGRRSRRRRARRTRTSSSCALPGGYETTIGERGQRLSGGQRQRLAIARAILRNSPILILDEATSALDSESEMLVQDALSTLMLNRTSFVIAHRLSTVRRADLILVLDGGRIVERGTHDELLGARRRLCETLRAAAAGDRRTRRRARGACGSQEASRSMIKSMTGFASLTHEDERATIGVTVRAVNHRFLDLQLRMPQSLGDLEPRVRAILQKRLARGRVELGDLGCSCGTATTPTVELNVGVRRGAGRRHRTGAGARDWSAAR